MIGSVTELCAVIGWNSRVCRLEEVSEGMEGKEKVGNGRGGGEREKNVRYSSQIVNSSPPSTLLLSCHLKKCGSMGRAEFCVLDSMETFRLKPKSCGRAGRAAPEVGGATRSLR